MRRWAVTECGSGGDGVANLETLKGYIHNSLPVMPRKLSAGRDMSLSRFFCVITLGLTGMLLVGWTAVAVEAVKR